MGVGTYSRFPRGPGERDRSQSSHRTHRMPWARVVRVLASTHGVRGDKPALPLQWQEAYRAVCPACKPRTSIPWPIGMPMEPAGKVREMAAAVRPSLTHMMCCLQASCVESHDAQICCMEVAAQTLDWASAPGCLPVPPTLFPPPTTRPAH